MEEKAQRPSREAIREKAIELQARFLCLLIGISPIDPIDGSSNWWMFVEQATKTIDDLLARNFTFEGAKASLVRAHTPSQSHEPQPKSDQ